MMKLNDAANALEGIAGVPWRDMTDQEFETVSADYDSHFSPEQAGSLKRFFDHVDDAAGPKAGAAKGAR